MIFPLEYEIPMERNAAVAVQAKLLCIIAGMEPVDSVDGSPNWWVFQEEAGKIVDDIRRRSPALPKRASLQISGAVCAIIPSNWA